MTAIRFAAIDDIGPTIRQLRKAKHWSQEQLAKEAGVSKATVTLVESGDRIPHTPKLIALLWALGYELAAIKRGEQ